MQVHTTNTNYHNPSFNAYFNNNNSNHLKRLFNVKYDELAQSKIKENLKWFTEELPNHELEISRFENLAGINASQERSRSYAPYAKYINIVGNRGGKHEGKYTILNKNTGISIDVHADNIIQFFDGIKKQSKTLFDNTKNTLSESFDEFAFEIISKLTKH